jgi:HSP20 family protein
MVNLVPWKKKNSVKVQNGNGGLSRNRYDDGFHPMARFRQEFDQLWDRFWDDWGGTSLTSGSHGGRWNLDLEDKENEYVVNADLPGFEPNEIDVSVSGNVMTVRAEHKEEEKNKNGSSYRYGSFYESFTLPCGVESDKIDAKYHNGVLNVHLPKSEDCKAKKIAVKSA